jgi:hypothetical protein
MDGLRNQISEICQQADEDCGAGKRSGDKFRALLEDIKKKNMILQDIITKSVDGSDSVMLQVIQTFETAGQTVAFLMKMTIAEERGTEKWEAII